MTLVIADGEKLDGGRGGRRSWWSVGGDRMSYMMAVEVVVVF